MLLFRLSVWFLLRFAERRFLGLLFQEPPRKTRKGAGQATATDRTIHRAEDRLAQAPGAGVPGVGDPRPDTPLDVLEVYRVGAPAVTEAAQPVAEPSHVVLGQAPPATGKQHIAEEPRRRRRRCHVGLAGMQR